MAHPAKSVFISCLESLQYRSWIKLVRPLSTVDNTRGYARVSHSRAWSNYNVTNCILLNSSHWPLTKLLNRRILHYKNKMHTVTTTTEILALLCKLQSSF